MFSLQGMSIAISGAAGGIGSATARLCSRLGASLILMDITTIDPEPDLIAAGARCFACDLTDRAAVDRLAADVGPVDGIVAAAGLQPYDDWLDVDWEENWKAVLDTNALGTVNFVRAFFGSINKGGRIVLVGSQAGRNGGAYSSPHYVFAKGGTHIFCRWLAKKGLDNRILVNAVAPGPVATPFIDGINVREGDLPLGRICTPEEVAGPIAFLLSPAASYVNGVILDVNGGLSFN